MDVSLNKNYEYMYFYIHVVVRQTTEMVNYIYYLTQLADQFL